jgi:ATP-dependent RNA helicase SUPV3L1/SUV3
LVLWSLWSGLQEFPESPPPGLVTIPNLADVPRTHYTLSGYHPAGTRAIRIDMLERLADLLRAKDSRAGFEAMPEMLSITGMTLEQFADLMTGLGYKAEKAERPKVKTVELPAPSTSTAPIPEEESVLAPPPEPEAPVEGEEPAPVEMEVFYSFSWAPKPRFQRPERPQGDRPRGDRPARPQGDRPQGDRPKRAEGDAKPQGERPPRADRPQGDRPQSDRPQGDRPQGDRPQGERRDRGKGGDFKGGKGGGKFDRNDRKDGGKDGGKPQGAKTFEARPPRVEKPIDPDNPFAVLAALKNKV